MGLNIPEGVENPYKDGYLMAENMKGMPILPTNITAYTTILDHVAFKFSQRIQLATQHYLLGVFSSESYQVANYGIGGQYGNYFSVRLNGFFRLFPIISISQIFLIILFLTLEKIGIDEKVICYHNISNLL